MRDSQDKTANRWQAIHVHLLSTAPPDFRKIRHAVFFLQFYCRQQAKLKLQQEQIQRNYAQALSTASTAVTQFDADDFMPVSDDEVDAEMDDEDALSQDADIKHTM